MSASKDDQHQQRPSSAGSPPVVERSDSHHFQRRVSLGHEAGGQQSPVGGGGGREEGLRSEPSPLGSPEKFLDPCCKPSIYADLPTAGPPNSSSTTGSPFFPKRALDALEKIGEDECKMCDEHECRTPSSPKDLFQRLPTLQNCRFAAYINRLMTLMEDAKSRRTVHSPTSSTTTLSTVGSPPSLKGLYSLQDRSAMFSHVAPLPLQKQGSTTAVVGPTCPMMLTKVRGLRSQLRDLSQFHDFSDTQKMCHIEAEERDVLEGVAIQYFDLLMTTFRKLLQQIRKDENWTGGPLSERHIHSAFRYGLHHMKTYIRQHAVELWYSEGPVDAFSSSSSLRSTGSPPAVGTGSPAAKSPSYRAESLSAKKAFLLGATLLYVDDLLADEDMLSFALSFYPGQRMTADRVPAELLPQFYSALAAKSALMLIRDDISAFKHSVIKTHFALASDPFVPPPSHEVALDCVMSMMALQRRRYERVVKDLTQYEEQFLAFCMQVQKDLLGSTCSDDAADEGIQTEYQKGEVIGRGSFGVVYRCLNTQDGKFLALKELPLPKDPRKLASIQAEVNTLKILRHDNIVSFYGAEFDRKEKKVKILMEYGPKSLRNVVDECKGLTMKLVAHYSRKILAGLAYLHERHIVHRDIKAANILVTDLGEIKVSDFGTALMKESKEASPSTPAKEVTEEGFADKEEEDEEDEDEVFIRRMQERVAQKKRPDLQLAGTPLFLAPELLNGADPSEASDIWAFGCLLIELVTGGFPWEELTGGVSLPVPILLRHLSTATEPPQLPEDLQVPEVFREFLYRCLTMDHHARPTAAELLDHSFLTARRGSLAASRAHAQGRRESDLSTASSGLLSSLPAEEDNRGEVQSLAVQRSKSSSRSGNGDSGGSTYQTAETADSALVTLSSDFGSPLDQTAESEGSLQ